jgi:hypothetical protein
VSVSGTESGVSRSQVNDARNVAASSRLAFAETTCTPFGAS